MPIKQMCQSTLPLKGLKEFLALHPGCADENRYPHFLKFTKFNILSQFVKTLFLKFPFFMSKTTSSLWHITKGTEQYRNEHSSWITVLAWGQNVKTYLITQYKFLLILKMGVPVFSSVTTGITLLNCAKPFRDMVYWHISLSGEANRLWDCL